MIGHISEALPGDSVLPSEHAATTAALHCLNERRRERGKRDVPLGQRGARELEPIAR